MQATLDRQEIKPRNHILVTLYMLVVGAASLILTHQLLTGWIALGKRANLSRHDLNATEWFAAIIALCLGIAALRTAWGLFTEEKVALKWAQWMALIFMVAGFVIDMNAVLSATDGGNFEDKFSWITSTIGLVILAVSYYVYQAVTRGQEHTPIKHLGIQLSESPSAGAIIGFVAILVGFSMATTLFLEPTSIASVLSNNA
ncbi:MAG: hypothetical protein K8I82_03075, partial [Anaerolineae bacterium]|nr:hypothetical protein [Anaerolineae bacterium]